LQEIDHVPFVAPLSRHAATVREASRIPAAIDDAFERLRSAPGGPVFLDLPLDALWEPVATDDRTGSRALTYSSNANVDRDIATATELLDTAERPAIMAGTGVYWCHAERQLLALAERIGAPVYVNGLGRGCVPADHDLYRSRTRGHALREADVVLVVGTPLDFRLGFGESIGENTKLIWCDASPPERPHPRIVDIELTGDVASMLSTIANGCTGDPNLAERNEWRTLLEDMEHQRRARMLDDMADDRAPLHPMRVYSELKALLDRDATIVCDGGDFVSFGGRMIDSFEPGKFLDPGPFGCLGCGPGYALAAGLANPGKQTVMLVGDGAFGFAGLEFDTLVRHNVPVVAVMGNNGIWALEKHPMEMLFGYAVAADLQPELRYDTVVEALGGHGELVRSPDELRPALERAFESGKPALVNVLTDPDVQYPRATNLA
jgi:acetolactate synthase-1/2/3 large subunit